MSTSGQMDNNCATNCRIGAVVGGVVIALVFWALIGFAFLLSALIGIVAGVLLWFLLPPMLCSETQAGQGNAMALDTSGVADPQPAVAPAPPAPAPAPEAAPVAEKAAPEPAPVEASEPAVKPSTALPGQAELAERKGTWRYEAEEAPAETPVQKAEVAEDTTASVKESAPLPGQAELAARKGEWTYDGGKVATGDRPVALDGPKGGTADDLKKIKGIGPKLEQLCNRLGVYHFEQIAGWSAGEVAWMDANLEGFKGRVSRDEWVSQARQLAAGGETEFSKRVETGAVY